MQWRDDLSEETSMTKRDGNDDEARLWKDNANDKLIATRDESADRARPVDKTSMEIHVRSAASSPGPCGASAGDTLRCNTSNCIHVTSETSVTYS